MSDELEQLRADLEVIERYSSYAVLENARYDIAEKIKRIENPDPWQMAKAYFDFQRKRAKEVDPRYLPMSEESKHALSYVDHLAAENERLTERVAKLEGIAVWGIHSQIDGHLIKAFESEAEAASEIVDYAAKQTTTSPHFLEVRVSNAREIVKAIRSHQECENRFRISRDENSELAAKLAERVAELESNKENRK